MEPLATCPVPQRTELLELGDESQASGGVAGRSALVLLGVAQTHCPQAVSSNLALQPTLQSVGWAASHCASSLLSEVQVERAYLAEGSLHFQSRDSWHWGLENPGYMSHRDS